MSYKEIRRNDECWRDNLIGCTFSKRLEQAALRRHSIESALTRLDIQKRHLQMLLAGRKAELLPNMHESVMCAVLEPKSRKILDVGFNVPEDLILDNFGLWLAGLIRAPVAAETQVTLVDIDGVNRQVRTYYTGTGTFNCYNYFLGTRVQVGSGSTTPARDDYAIETPFGSSPEDTQADTGTGSYAAGYVSLSGAITAGGSGTINETGLFGHWRDTSSYHYFMLFHDKLGTGVGFSAGQTLNVSYSIEL